jgi:hypothetical protein
MVARTHPGSAFQQYLRTCAETFRNYSPIERSTVWHGF